MSTTDSFWLAMVIALPIAVVAVAAVFRHRREKLLATTGRRATGRVLASGRDGDSLSGETHWVSVQYNYDGELVTAKAEVSPRDQKRYRIGQPVRLTYAPSRPQLVRLDPPQ